MKKYILIFIFVALGFALSNDIDVNKKPEPTSASDFSFPEYQTKILSNGIKLFVIEDKEQPTVYFRILLNGGSSMDGEKIGVSELTSDMLSKGTKKRKAFAISSTIDGLGASFSISSGPDNITGYGGGLKKHINSILDVVSDYILNPIFPKEEFEKLINQKIAELQYEKSNPSSIAANLSRKVVFGETHPYSKKANEESLKSIKIEDLKSYHSKYFLPNNASIAVIGDISLNEAQKLIEKYFGNWKKGEKPIVNVPEPQPQAKGVYFINRPGSVQSSIIISTLGIPYNYRDYEALDLAGSVIGAGFAGRLFRTLRETYSFTYTPFGYVTRSKFANRFVCGAEVASAKTDSSVLITLEQLQLLSKEAPSDDELNRIKSYKVGSYLMSFEDASFVASLIQNADFMEKSIDLVKAFPTRLNAISNIEVRNIARKYMNTDNAFIVVSGDPSVKKDLEKFGTIFEYDLDLNPLSGPNAKLEKISLNPSELLAKYADAIGGKNNLNSITTIIAEGKGNFIFQGNQSEVTYKRLGKVGYKMHQHFDIGGYPQRIWTNGTESYSDASGSIVKYKESDLRKQLLEAELFQETKLMELGYKCKVIGIKDNMILMNAISPENEETILYFDSESYLLIKKENYLKLPSGTEIGIEKFDNYKKFDNLMLPTKLLFSATGYSIDIDVNYKINQEIADSEFEPTDK